jgi:hypothetical protein
MTIRIYGAGMAGLLVSEMLRRARPVVYEAQSSLPDNHGALLRFRSDAVARETRQPFKRVRVLKAVKSGDRLRPVSTIRDANQYAAKVTGSISPRSVLDLTPCDRYIAPDSFITALARDAILKMNAALTPATLAELKGQKEIVSITTIPMPVLMKIAGWEAPGFKWRPIWSQTVDLGATVDVYQTIYYPEPSARQYRASITGSKLIIEWTTDPTPTSWADVCSVLKDFGILEVHPQQIRIYEVKRQEYGKLLPLADENVRREFIMAMTDEYNMYSVGRFATWRQILLDDVVSDVAHVESMINQRSAYHQRLHNGGALGG